MTLNREQLAKTINSRLNQLAEEVKCLTGNRLNDAAKILETVTLHFLNALHGWSLRDLNDQDGKRVDFPAADLGDDTRRFAVQVTNDADAQKIRQTRETALDPRHNLAARFDRLIILFWVAKKPKTPPSLFQQGDCPKIETQDLTDILAELLKVEDPAHLQGVLTVLEREMTRFNIGTGGAAPRLSPPRFLHHTAEIFLGREPELAMLDTAWADGTNLLSIVAWGGVGKTALLAQWIATRFISPGWRDAGGSSALLAYFDWSFYDQGTRALAEGVAVRTGSVGDFFEQALVFFGDENPSLPGKGARLARFVQQQRTLLILDGLEPLQQPVGHPMAGRLLDPDVRDLLCALAADNPGLCLVSSRQALTDLHGLPGRVQSKDLEDLPVAVAVRLLQKFQITGTGAELAAACEQFHCHALSITLLGRFLFDAHGGDIARLDRVRDLQRADNLTRPERHRTAWRVLVAYEEWLASAKPGAQPDTLAVLRLTGLFDRVATAGCLAALRAQPVIPGLTDAVHEMDDDRWTILLRRLERAHLLKLRHSADRPGQHDIDAHPLVREYFAKRLRTEHPEAFRAAHSRLFDYLCESAPECTRRYQVTAVMHISGLAGLGEMVADPPYPTLSDLQPLYQAVTHGCIAGREEEACNYVYRDRIQRGPSPLGSFSMNRLGAISADLGAVTAFFRKPWSLLSPRLSPSAQSWLLNEAATRLSSLGFLTDAVDPMRLALERCVRASDWKNAAADAMNLSEMELILGHLKGAAEIAHRAVSFADRSGNPIWIIGSRAAVADALFQAGDRLEAAAIFADIARRQKVWQPEFPHLYSIQGFLYGQQMLGPTEQAAWRNVGCSLSGEIDCSCETVLTKGKTAMAAICDEVESLAHYQIATRQPTDSLLTIAHDLLTLARSRLYLRLLCGNPSSIKTGNLPAIATAVANALASFRLANQLQHLPKALLTAALYAGAVAGRADEVRRHLDGAQLIAERGPMPLYLADVHLHRARLMALFPEEDRARYFPGTSPRTELAKARALIEKHGYWRRREELADAEAFLPPEP